MIRDYYKGIIAGDLIEEPSKCERREKDGNKIIFIDKKFKEHKNIEIPVKSLTNFQIETEESVVLYFDESKQTIECVRCNIQLTANYKEADDAIHLKATLKVTNAAQHGYDEAISEEVKLLSEDLFFDAIVNNVNDPDKKKLHRDAYVKRKINEAIDNINKKLLKACSSYVMYDSSRRVYTEFYDVSGQKVANSFTLNMENPSKHNAILDFGNATFLNAGINEKDIKYSITYLHGYEIKTNLTSNNIVRFYNNYNTAEFGRIKVALTISYDVRGSLLDLVDGDIDDKTKEEKTAKMKLFEEINSDFCANVTSVLIRHKDNCDIETDLYADCMVKNFIVKAMIDINSYFIF